MNNTALAFFERHYRSLRSPYVPMDWMRRLFLRIVEGRPPKLVDLPTGAGKTELIVVWLIALAWHGENRASRTAIPRRLVWIVNRRVLVQQVFSLSELLTKKLACPESGCPAEAEHLSALLGRLCRPGVTEPFRVVQLRGQLVDDREWTFDPTIPQLIIGTVDQIGSRLLFQGYGLGKWSRPLHAALLGVDAWICVDEAHLVPEFALTLRQIGELARAPIRGDDAMASLGATVGALPLWTTELSATPALERPSEADTFTITGEDEADTSLGDRLLASRTREVQMMRVADKQSVAKSIEVAAAALFGHVRTAAIFCSKAKDAMSIAKALKKDRRIGTERVLVITGRLRGYERDRIQDTEAFKAFKREGIDIGEADTNPVTFYLVGTAAAEVGLDADADTILCDFAPIPTLIQRLGRLDRRGVLCRKSVDGNSLPPKMTIYASAVSDDNLKDAIEKLSVALSQSGHAADAFAASSWRQLAGATSKPDSGDTKANTISPEDVVAEASLRILRPSESTDDTQLTTRCNTWLAHPYARITVGPIVVPPLNGALLQQWAASTVASSPFLPVHPWLYGLLPDERGTPLVGIVFRLELDLLRFAEFGPDDDADDLAENLQRKILNVLRRFPPLRSELHFVPLAEIQGLLRSHAGTGLEIARFDGDEWTWYSPKARLQPDNILVFGTSMSWPEIGTLLEGSDALVNPVSDVLGAVSAGTAKYYRQVIESSASSDWRIEAVAEHVFRVVPDSSLSNMTQPSSGESVEVDPSRWQIAKTFTLQGNIGSRSIAIRYFVPARPRSNAQWLADHLNTAKLAGEVLAEAIAPADEFMRALLSHAGSLHDLGKQYEPWQRAMGNSDPSNPIAKPTVEHPASTHGYRHEWGSLLAIADHPPLNEVDGPERALWLDLLQHLVGSHHGFLRPSLPDKAFPRPPAPGKQAQLRLESTERYARLQSQLNPWRLAFLEGLVKAIDVVASRDSTMAIALDAAEDSDEQ